MRRLRPAASGSSAAGGKFDCRGKLDDERGGLDWFGRRCERFGSIAICVLGVCVLHVRNDDSQLEYSIGAIGVESELGTESLLRQRDDGHSLAGDVAADIG